MNKTLKGFLFGVLSAVGLIGLTAASNNDYIRGKSLEIFFNVFRDINLSYVDEPDSDKLVIDALNGMLTQLDPYTVYMPAEEYEEFEEMTTGEYAGVGAVIFKHSDTLYAEIAEVVENSPAFKAGLIVGDKLVSVDTTNLKNLDTKGVSSLLRGDAGSTFKLNYISMLDGGLKSVDVKREIIHSPAVVYYGYIRDTDGIGYISLKTFSATCSSEVRKAIEALREERELKGLIIDLRDNGGGVLQEAVNIVSLFVEKGTEVVSIKGRDKRESKVFKTFSAPIALDLPLAVIVNNSSASASEVVSGALQDLDRALIVGSQTYGKGLVQTPKDVGFGSVLKVTTAKYYTPSGRCIQAVDFSSRNKDGSVGLIPDSLKKEFLTKNGRTVFDGGGITPDTIVEMKSKTRFVQNVENVGDYLSGYVKRYYKTNPIAPKIEDFELTDEDLVDFANYLEEKNFEVLSLTNYYVDKLKESAESEYYKSRIGSQIEELEKKLKLNIKEDVELNKKELKLLLEMSIMTAYHFQRGKVEYFAQQDDIIKRTASYLTK